MKRLITSLTMAVAVVTIAAGTVSAQTMKADIPFNFQVGKQVMQPGAYRVSLLSAQGGSQLLAVSNQDTRQTVLAIVLNRAASKEYGQAKLTFVCQEESCRLRNISDGSGQEYTFHFESAKHGESRLAEITLRPDRGN